MTRSQQRAVFFMLAIASMLLAAVLAYTGFEAGFTPKMGVALFLITVTAAYVLSELLNLWFDFLRDMGWKG